MDREEQHSNNGSEETVDKRVVIKGLDNLGNTCYLNCCLQALYSTIEFREYLISDKWQSNASTESKPLHSSLTKLFKEMNANQNDKSIEPKHFWKTFTQFKPQFLGSEQHDAQECLRYIIDGIHEEVNAAKERRKKRNKRVAEVVDSWESAWKQFLKYTDESFLVHIFVGQMKSSIECLECHNRSDSWEHFWDISLSLPEKDDECDLLQCLKLFVENELLDTDSMPECSKCKTKRKSMKSMTFERLPLILIVHLKRFGNDGQKIHKEVKIDDNLKINAYDYTLFACISHRGYSCSGGHYVSHCRHYDKWYFFDDEDVTEVENLNVRQLTDAYILFYHVINKTVEIL